MASDARDQHYSAIQHLAMALYGAAWRTGEFALLTAYDDDTGKRNDTAVVSLFGFVADAEQWVRFDNDWRIVLGLPQFQLPYFHMRELRQGTKAKHPAFHKFDSNEPLRRDLYERLQAVIRVRTVQSFSATVLMGDEVSPATVATATAIAIGKFIAWRDHKRPGEPFKVVCDQDMDEWGKLDAQVYEGWKFRLVPGIVSEVPGLQASDFAAHQMTSSAHRLEPA